MAKSKSSSNGDPADDPDNGQVPEQPPEHVNDPSPPPATIEGDQPVATKTDPSGNPAHPGQAITGQQMAEEAQDPNLYPREDTGHEKILQPGDAHPADPHQMPLEDVPSRPLNMDGARAEALAEGTRKASVTDPSTPLPPTLTEPQKPETEAQADARNVYAKNDPAEDRDQPHRARGKYAKMAAGKPAPKPEEEEEDNDGLIDGQDARMVLAKDLAQRALAWGAINDLSKAVLLLIDALGGDEAHESSISKDAARGRAPALL